LLSLHKHLGNRALRVLFFDLAPRHRAVAPPLAMPVSHDRTLRSVPVQCRSNRHPGWSGATPTIRDADVPAGSPVFCQPGNASGKAGVTSKWERPFALWPRLGVGRAAMLGSAPKMANKFYQPGAQRAARVRDLFASIAPRYDLINDLQSFGLHRYWKKRLLNLAHVNSSHRVLDVCCGTGDVALAFARRGAQVIGADFSEPMLQMARARTEEQTPVAEWVRADALALPFASGSFDIVTVSYGLRNLADLERGLTEMARVAVPGGRLLVLDFGKPRARLLRAAYFAYLEHWVPVFGRWFCGDAAAYAYILESLRHYPAQDGVAALMQKLGCQSIQVLNLLGGIMSINYGEKQRDHPR
jgi:demethylmenaquinone methyltransferase / 2-methoxy-6-polyprenyl-1,4-benzoquinol methylase